MVVFGPWPGMTTVESGSGSSLLWMERMRVGPSPPGRSVRPTEPAKRVSPARSRFCVREIEADAALGVAWGVEDAAGDIGDGYELAVVEGVVGRADFGGGAAEPSGLDVHHLDQREVVLVVEDGRTGEGLETRGSGDVVDVRVGDEDLLDGEIVSLEEGEDAQNLVSGIDDDSFAGGLVAEDGAVALQRADGKDLVDHGDLDSW